MPSPSIITLESLFGGSRTESNLLPMGSWFTANRAAIAPYLREPKLVADAGVEPTITSI